MNMKRKMHVAALALATLALTGCGPKLPRFADGEQVRYNVNGVMGTGVVVSSQPRLDDGTMVYYYRVEVGVDSAGKRDQPLLHEALLKPIKK